MESELHSSAAVQVGAADDNLLRATGVPGYWDLQNFSGAHRLDRINLIAEAVCAEAGVFGVHRHFSR